MGGAVSVWVQHGLAVFPREHFLALTSSACRILKTRAPIHAWTAGTKLCPKVAQGTRDTHRAAAEIPEALPSIQTWTLWIVQCGSGTVGFLSPARQTDPLASTCITGVMSPTIVRRSAIGHARRPIVTAVTRPRSGQRPIGCCNRCCSCWCS